jgi:NADPH:quinone reductase-like Zn-dependent oxidoreductase
MPAVIFSKFGNPTDVLHLQDADPGDPAAGEVRVSVEAAPIHPSDLLTISGQYGMLPKLPAIPGNEGVGRVTALGDGVGNVKVGDLVFLPVGSGTWRSHMRIPARNLFALPEQAGPLQLSMSFINPMTALALLLDMAPLKAGDWVVQNAANSAVGKYLAVLAKRRGIHTACIVRRGGDLARHLKSLGATEVIVERGEHTPEDVRAAMGNAPVPLGIDAVGGAATNVVASCVNEGGLVVNYGGLSGKAAEMAPQQLVFRDIHLRGFWLVHWMRTHGHLVQQRFQEILGLVNGGALAVDVDGTYPLMKIKDAVRHAARDGRDGKVLLTPDEKF